MGNYDWTTGSTITFARQGLNETVSTESAKFRTPTDDNPHDLWRVNPFLREESCELTNFE